MLLVMITVGGGRSRASEEVIDRLDVRGMRMHGFHGLQRETETYQGEGTGSLDGQWLAPFLLLYVRDGDIQISELAEKLSGLGFGAVTPDGMIQTMRQMQEEGLVREDSAATDGAPPGSGVAGGRYSGSPRWASRI